MTDNTLLELKSPKWMVFIELAIAAFIILAANIFKWLPLSDTYYLCLLCLVSVMIRKAGWKSIGLSQTGNWKKVLLIAACAAAAHQLLSAFVTVPIIKLFTHQGPDLSSFKPLVGNPEILIYYLTLIWTLAAFGEEISFRGYIMGRIASIFKESKTGWIIALLIMSLSFGFAHYYQGPTGIADTAFSGLYFGGLYLYFKRNLWVTILAHGISDTIACFLVYFKLVAI